MLAEVGVLCRAGGQGPWSGGCPHFLAAGPEHVTSQSPHLDRKSVV